MKKILLFIGILFYCLSFGQSKSEKTKELMSILGSQKSGEQMLEYLITNYKKSYDDIPENFWIEFRKNFRVDDIANKIIPIYEENYSEEEIDGLLRFYKSPIGQSYLKKMPKVSAEVNEVSQIWAREISAKARQEIEKTSKYKSPPPPVK